MKKPLISKSRSIPLLKLNLKMKLSVLFIALTFFTMQANDTYGQLTKLSLNAVDESILNLIEEIESTTEFRFIYRKKDVDLNRKISLKADNQTLESILGNIFQNTTTNFKIKDKRVYLIPYERKTKIPIMVVNPESRKDSKNILQQTVKGTVKDKDGTPLPGTSIVEKGTANGTQTDFDGNFTINVTSNDAILVVSYIGFATQEIVLDNRTTLNIVLQEDSAQLDEVVLVGYGKLSRENLTGAVSSINSDKIDAFPAASVEQSLAGKLPGVQLSQSSGQPGAGISVRVRGITSISGGNEPLYVIDGVPFFNSDVRGLNGISSINPNDIESIQVLKDASSTAIYGSRGANGVVLVTTKSGKAGAKPSITYSTWLSTRSVRQKLNLMNGDEFLDFQRQFFENSGSPVPDEISEIQNRNTDWQDEVFRNGIATNHNISMSGGNENTQYYVSLNSLNEQGIILNSDFKRISFRTNLDAKLNNTFSIKTSITGSNSVQNGFSAAQNNNTQSFLTSGVGSILLALPTEPVFDSEGNFSNIFPYDFANQVENPVGYARQILDKTTVRRFLGNFTLESRILKGLTNYTRLGVDYQNIRGDSYFPLALVLAPGGRATVTNREVLNYVVENYFEYDAEILPELNFNAVFGGSLQEETSQSLFLQSSDFFSDELTNNAIQSGSSIAVPITNNIDQSIASAFARVNFIYKDRYLFGASVRSDGASVFSESNKVATFPSLSAGWKISNENFIGEDSKISNLKLRASWGKSGNPGIQPYQSLPLGIIVTTSQGAGTGLSTGLTPNLPNRSLTWETTTQTNFGVDFSMFDSRLRMSLDYYEKDTEDALTSVQLPPSGGFATIIDNVGAVQNNGIELALGGILVDKDDLTVSLDFNISKNSNEVTRLKDGQDLVSEFTFAQTADAVGGVSSVARVGEQLGAFLGFQFNGFDDSGEPEYEDFNDDGVLDDDDKIIIGNPIPEILYGFNSSIRFKNLNFTMDWQGVAQADILNIGEFNLTSPTNEYNRLANIYDFYPNVNQNSVHRISDRYVESGSFLRLRNVKIGYTIPIKSSIFDNINFFVSGQNLITITDYSGFDPDVNSLSGNDIKQGVDLAAYPAAKSYTLGLNVKF
ncbi:TonB-dependent receptor [Croceitalea sp. MTPC9]|uniref:TonB-dependent receptor n=1 Tax=unclassified Croceitalea TaxID=2632280 RepID=UPI002B392110|nr:TonB-dependent receptor [Croceitalea sp. MTPC6]GMN16147.1 TonB-dependent receptor [Croceitalea sp. MTPC9]